MLYIVCNWKVKTQMWSKVLSGLNNCTQLEKPAFLQFDNITLCSLKVKLLAQTLPLLPGAWNTSLPSTKAFRDWSDLSSMNARCIFTQWSWLLAQKRFLASWDDSILAAVKSAKVWKFRVLASESISYILILLILGDSRYIVQSTKVHIVQYLCSITF